MRKISGWLATNHEHPGYNLPTKPRWTVMPKNNVYKRKARPKRSIDRPGDDHDLGLWIDYELLRKHQGRPAQTIIHDPVQTTNSRYLELADLVLANGKSKKKSKAATSND
jgi:hypothetical protein